MKMNQHEDFLNIVFLDELARLLALELTLRKRLGIPFYLVGPKAQTISGTGLLEEYTCPSGKTVVIRYIVMYSDDSNAQISIRYVNGQTGEEVKLYTMGPTASELMYLVLNEGDKLRLYADQVGATSAYVGYAVVGYILDKELIS